MKPPHLPRETCSIKQHDQVSRIKILLVTVFFGLLAGGTGAIIVLGWIWPNTEIGSTWIVSQNRGNEQKASLESSVASDVDEKIYTVYEKSMALGQNNLSLENKLGDAVSVSSDGWLVMYLVAADIQNIKNWPVVDRDGTVFKVSDYRYDPLARIAYLKVLPINEKDNDLTQFKVIGFYQDEPADSDLEVFSFDGKSWRTDYLTGRYDFISSEMHLDSMFNFGYVSDGNVKPGQPLINKRGWLVGFAMENNLVLPARAVSEILPLVLSGQKIKYPGFGVSGWFSEEKPIVVNGEKAEGFLVSKVWSGKSLLKKNDVILEVNNIAVSGSEIFFDFSTEPKTLKILRDGKNLEISAQPIFASENDFNNL